MKNEKWFLVLYAKNLVMNIKNTVGSYIVGVDKIAIELVQQKLMH